MRKEVEIIANQYQALESIKRNGKKNFTSKDVGVWSATLVGMVGKGWLEIIGYEEKFYKDGNCIYTNYVSVYALKQNIDINLLLKQLKHVLYIELGREEEKIHEHQINALFLKTMLKL